MLAEIIGWSAAGILLFTLGRQVFTEWRDRSTRGLSKWLFVGQMAASTGFLIYSWLLSNWVFKEVKKLFRDFKKLQESEGSEDQKAELVGEICTAR